MIDRDWALCRWLAVEAGVVAIPPSAFYSPPNKVLLSLSPRLFSRSRFTMTALPGLSSLGWWGGAHQRVCCNYFHIRLL